MTMTSKAIAAIIAATTPGVSTPALHAIGEQFSGVVHVIDGDTIQVDATRVRIHAIDAAETQQLCQRANSTTYACGNEATAYLRNIAEGRTATCTAKAIDKYHRTVAACTVDGKDIGAAMVSSGNAVAFRRYSSAYDGEEMQARNAKRGLWAGEFQNPADYRRAKRSGSF